LQWEDFANPHARPILEKYGNRLCTFNDDIQGTAAVAVSALLAAVSAVGAQMKDQKVVMFGAGSAGMGIANLIAAEMIAQGLSEEEAAARIYLVDRPGLLHSKIDDIQPAQKRFQKDFEKIKANWKVQSENINFEEVVKNCGATVLIGTSSQPGAFSQSVVQAMSASCAHPVILPLSNPTSKCEAKPQDVLEWSQGKALVATGSPFDPVTIDGQLHTIGQCNNCYIFPGMGLAVVASGMNRVTDSMFLQAARALAKEAPAIKNKYDSLFPPLDKIRSVSEKIAIAVIKEAIALGMVKNLNVDDVEAKVKQTMWEPVYKTIKYKPE
jgi:malate dehydrogenase (oxaloacetate-decarboxylating)